MFDYRRIMSGRRRDLPATFLRGALLAASGAYRLVIERRNRRFDSGADVHRVDIPVISVGNLTTGGTGKTPVVCYLATWFRRHRVRVAIVSRGYGRGAQDENDEALELHARLPDVPHVQDPDRVAAASLAAEEFESQLLLLDDAFQHRRLHRDLDIVVIDATCPFGYGHLLPRGLLREPLSGLARAGLVIISRTGGIAPEAIAEIERVIRLHHATCPIIHSDHQPSALLEYPATRFPVDQLNGKRVAAVSAIGNAEAFEASLVRGGATVVEANRLPDHDPYAPDTVAALRQWILQLGDSVEMVVCTHKDLVKLATDRMGGRPLRALLIELAIVRGEEELHRRLTEVMAGIAQDDGF